VSILGHCPLAKLRARIIAAGAFAGVLSAAVTTPGEPARPTRPSDARRGALIDYEPRPLLPRELRACSLRRPLCVHEAGAAHPYAEVLAWVDAMERAWDLATGALDLPPPDTALASTGALDVYVVDGDAYATRVEVDRRDPRGGFDRAGSFALVGRGAVRGCRLDIAAARVVTRATLFGVSPATDDGSALAETAYVSRLMVPCAAALAEELALFQDRPELGLADTLAPPDDAIRASPARLAPTSGETYSAGASLFYDWVEDAYGGYPGAIVRAMWALSPTVTPVGAARWNDEPDGFEVLRTSFKNALTTGSTVDDLWLEFAVARAFVPQYPVRRAWTIDWPLAPRNLTSAAGVAPTGASYIAIDCRARPKGARLRFEARWEEHARMLWTLVRVDSDGRELGWVNVPGPNRGTEAQTTLVDLDGSATVLAVGTNSGDTMTPFDPDDYVWEPHGWVVSLAAE